MLAQSFKSAADLEITEPQLAALQKTLVLLETGKLVHRPTYNDDDTLSDGVGRIFSGEFNMNTFATSHRCGTVACIAGTAELVGKVKFAGEIRPEALEYLFYAGHLVFDMRDITPSQAATALRSYLTTGDARWDLAVAS